LDSRTGIILPNEFDKAFTPILSSNDKGESPTNGALLVAPYGKILYYWFKFIQRIAGRSAWRLPPLSNMISLKAPMSAPAKA
jgi:hypothetical protein